MTTIDSALSPQQLLERLQWRYATKQFDPNQKIEADTWEALETTLQLTPSSGGLQPWKFIVVTDPAVRTQLLAASWGQAQIADASHLVVFAASTNFGEAEVDKLIKHTADSRGITVESLSGYRNMLLGGIVQAMDSATRQVWASRQTYIALGNLVTSAALLGVDACPMEGISIAEYDRILGLKAKGLATTAIVTLGYRKENDPYATLPKVRFEKADLFIHV